MYKRSVCLGEAKDLLSLLFESHVYITCDEMFILNVYMDMRECDETDEVRKQFRESRNIWGEYRLEHNIID